MKSMNDFSCMPLANASCRYLTASSGVPAGAPTARHVPMDRSMPFSFSVGTSGNVALRLSAITAMIFSLPASTCEATSGGLATKAWMCPPSTACTVGAAPAYGICSSSMPAFCAKAEADRCQMLPNPELPTLILPGLRLRFGDELLERVELRVGRHDQAGRVFVDEDDRAEVLAREGGRLRRSAA